MAKAATRNVSDLKSPRQRWCDAKSDYDWPSALRTVHEACTNAYTVVMVLDSVERQARDSAVLYRRDVMNLDSEAYYTWQHLEQLLDRMAEMWVQGIPL